jgi:phosphate transport system protein
MLEVRLVPVKEPPMVHTPHLDTQYENELRAVRAQVARMADQAERMVRDSVLALLSSDDGLAREVIAADQVLDQMELDCDQLCVRLLARRAPVGADLRLVTATLKLVTDIERIGDLAVNIVKRGTQAGGAPLPAEIAELARAVVEELALSMDCLRSLDSGKARRLYDQDHITDQRNRAAFDRLLRLAGENPGVFDQILAMTNICRHLERIGDHAVNVAEAVVYMVEGATLRHKGA